MSLTDTAIRNAKAGARAYKLTDGRGLTLLIQPSGAKWWRFRYRFEGVEKMLSVGVYPDVSLREARDRCEAARRQLASRVNPSVQRKVDRASRLHTFEEVARHWLAQLAREVRKKKRSLITFSKAKWMLEAFVFPSLGTRPVASITPPELLTALKAIEVRGMRETARRTKQRCGQVFRHAIGLGYAQRDITSDLRGLLEPPIVRHHAAITDPARIGELLRAIETYSGQATTACALKLAPLLFVRPSELRQAEWREFNLEAAEWRIPAARMKMRTPHIVPLSDRAVRLLTNLHERTGDARYLFPALGNPSRTMSENTVNAALRRLGYSGDEMTGHGFRSMASTILNERGWNRDAIERQLAHGERDAIRSAYNYAEYLPERRRMMQAWCDYLNELRAPPSPLQRDAA